MRTQNLSEPVDPPPDWFCLSASEVAKRLGLHPKTITRNYRRYGGRFCGGRLRFSLNGIRGSLK